MVLFVFCGGGGRLAVGRWLLAVAVLLLVGRGPWRCFSQSRCLSLTSCSVGGGRRLAGGTSTSRRARISDMKMEKIQKGNDDEEKSELVVA